MQPITNTIPKPLVNVSGKTLLDHALDALAAERVSRVSINVHYLAEQIENHVKPRKFPKVEFSDERRKLLDSGGGVKQAVKSFEHGPFLILNADSFWVDGPVPNLEIMTGFWDDSKMDMLLLTSPKVKAVGFEGPGDFFIEPDGRLIRRGEAKTAPAIYAGAIIAKAEQFHAVPEAKFSLNVLFDQAIAKRRLFGIMLDGLWLHVGTPMAIDEAESAIDDHLKAVT